MDNSLRDPLVQNDESGSNAKQDESSGQVDDGQKFQDSSSLATCASSSRIWEELEKQLWIALPMIVVGVLQNAISVVSLAFVGHLGELELASSSVAMSFANVTGIALLIGMGSTLETLCGQAVGAKQYRMVGIYLQRAILALNAVSIPVAVLWANMGAILRALQQDPEISDYAGRYAQWMIPTLFAYATLQPVVRYIQTQSAVFPMACCSTLTLCLHIPISWLLTNGIGYRGAAIANAISQWLNLLLLVIYIRFSPKFEKTWTGFSVEAFQQMDQFLWLAVPSALMICFEYWCFELLLLISGLLPNPELEMSAFSISLVVLSLLYNVPDGITAAASTRVSNELGAGQPSAAKMAVGVSMSIAICEGLITSILFWTLRNVWPHAFTSEQEVLEYMASWIPILAAVPLLDAFQTVLGGVIRGCGRQHLGAYINLCAYYLVGLPAGIILAFYFNMGGRGLRIGMLAAIGVQLLSYGLILFFTNWQEQARRARDLVADGRLPTEKVLS